MNIKKPLFSFLSLALMLGVMLPMAKADDENQATVMTFSQPVEIPGHVLPAGTYQFVLADTSLSLNIVQIFNADRTKLYATVHTVPATRLEPTGETVVSLAERTSGQPDAIKKWFYPGSREGHEFVYGAREERELAGDSMLVLPVSAGGAVSGD